MFYIQFSYEQMSILSKLNQQIKLHTGTNIRLSDDDVLEKIDKAMRTIENEEIVKTYQNLQSKLNPEISKQKTEAKKPKEKIENKHTKKIMYRGSVIEIESKPELQKHDNKDKKTKKIYRGQILND